MESPTRMRLSRHLTGAALLLLLVGGARPARLDAQERRGTVRDSASGQPVPAAVVLLLDSLGRTVGRSTTNERGQFRITGSGEARALRVLRLGFRPRETRLANVAGAGAPVEVRIVPIPVLLGQVRVTAPASCPRRADR